ncbi:hypothetical protein MUP00_07875 [Candidatus Bathyarchaeota archaeon]|nr:hypothetical protein [Candidatus Bathyarchaeota archaeon]
MPECARGRGKPLRLVRLTSTGLNIVKSFVEAAGTRPRKFEDADPQDIKFYLEMITDFSNRDVQDLAVAELASLCETYSVMQDPRILPFLKERILTPQYQPLRHGLMVTLLNMTRNSQADQKRETIRPGFADALTRLLSEPLDETQADSRATRATAMEVLSLIHEGDEGFKALTTVLIGLIERKDHLDERAEDLIIWKYPDKRGELRRAMFKLLTSPDKDVVRRAKELIPRLRTRTGLSGE